MDGQWLTPAAAGGRQRRRKLAGDGEDLVVGHGEPPGVGLEGGFAHAHARYGAERIRLVVGADAYGRDGETGPFETGEQRRAQASRADHAVTICFDVQAYDLSGCGLPVGGGTAPVAGLCDTGGVSVFRTRLGAEPYRG